jgi:hypothetical protein
MAETSLQDLKNGLTFAMAAIASEHFFSAGLSSPWTTGKFAKDSEDQRKVWKAFWLAAGGSAAFAVAISLIIGNGESMVYSLLGAGAIIAWMWYEYDSNMNGTF